MRTAIVIALLLVATAPARADHKRKEPGIAFVLPLGVTFLGAIASLTALNWEAGESFGEESPVSWKWPAIVGAVALLPGPSLGGIYAGDVWNVGLGVRLGGAAVVGGGLVISAVGSHTNSGIGPASAIAKVVGVLAYGVGAVIEIVKAPLTAQRRNRAALAISPTAGSSPGVSLLGTF